MKRGYSKAQMDALVQHVTAQMRYRADPGRETAEALLDARRKLARACGGTGDGGNMLDGVRIRREHLPTNLRRR
jgi:hypothetical protein